ncbi:MAG: ABC-2 type transport system ATP-binding protein [Myxococcota bacterium]
MSVALRFESVDKRYTRRGPKALDGCSFEVPVGTVCGLVGPNGAGKTTAFSVVSGFLSPDGGRVDILGEAGFDPWRLRGRLGVLPQDAQLPSRHTPIELLVHLGRLQGLAGAAWAEARRVLELVRLQDRMASAIGSLSHGMRRRVAVASALIGQPELILLDEPLAGLDPVQAHSLRDVLAGLGATSTLVVSSHNLAELERICDWVVMLDAGRCLRAGPLAEVTGRRGVMVWELAGVAPLEALAEAVPGHTWRVDGDRWVQEAPPGVDLDAASLAVLRVFVAHGVAVRGMQRGVSLEASFLEGR